MKIKDLGKTIKQRRESLGIGIHEIAADMYMPARNYKERELGLRSFTAPELVYLCMRFGLKVDDLIEKETQK